MREPFQPTLALLGPLVSALRLNKTSEVLALEKPARQHSTTPTQNCNQFLKKNLQGHICQRISQILGSCSHLSRYASTISMVIVQNVYVLLHRMEMRCLASLLCIIKFFHLFYISTIDLPPSSLPSPHLLSTPLHPTLLHSEGDRPSMRVNEAWLIKLRQDQETRYLSMRNR